jgi:hypothetical protein
LVYRCVRLYWPTRDVRPWASGGASGARVLRHFPPVPLPLKEVARRRDRGGLRVGEAGPQRERAERW